MSGRHLISLDFSISIMIFESRQDVTWRRSILGNIPVAAWISNNPCALPITIPITVGCWHHAVDAIFLLFNLVVRFRWYTLFYNMKFSVGPFQIAIYSKNQLCGIGSVLLKNYPLTLVYGRSVWQPLLRIVKAQSSG